MNEIKHKKPNKIQSLFNVSKQLKKNRGFSHAQFGQQNFMFSKQAY